MQVIIVAQATNELDDDHEDIEIPGMYEASLAADTPADLRASAALDGFHRTFAVGELDDFSFTVYDKETGEELDEPDDVESYENGDFCQGVEFVSRDIDPKYLEQPKVRPGM